LTEGHKIDDQSVTAERQLAGLSHLQSRSIKMIKQLR